MESRLNTLVYQAFNLTPDEIRLIEGEQPADPTIQEIADQYPNQWVAIEITETDETTRKPLRGILRASGDEETVMRQAGEILDEYASNNNADQAGLPMTIFHTNTVSA